MSTFKRLVIGSMFVAFVVSSVTGIIKFPELQKYFLFVYNFLSASTISMIHDWSGIVLLLLIIVHLILIRHRLKVFFLGGYVLPKAIFKTIYIIVGIIIVGGITIYLYVNHSVGNKAVNLSAVEVTQYQGEKLGSINDFRENSIKGPQYVDKKSYKLEISGLVEPNTSYSYSDMLSMPMYQKVVTLNCVEGWSVKALWEGVLVKDLLNGLTVKPEAKAIIFYAADGYSTSFPLDYVLRNDIIMADKLNGEVLPPERGFPFQLVAEQKWGYKWIKWITKIELSNDTNYKGFWESRGYNNNGDLSGSKFSP